MTEKSPIIYPQGNVWQKKVYTHMATFLEVKEVTNFSTSERGDQPYKHLLSENEQKLNFITDEIYKATEERFADHKAGDFKRVSTNTAASQAYCFNLFVPLNQNKQLASKLFSKLFGKEIFINHIEIEFTPNAKSLDKLDGFERQIDETIGDQGAVIGTDADVAIFYTYGNGKKGILLIEFKFIEPKFSVCSSYKNKKQIKGICDSQEFYKTMVENKAKDERGQPLCGYNKYSNWNLTKGSKFISQSKVIAAPACPFKKSLNQLWRNALLAEKVAKARKLDEFGFWVFSPKENDEFLWENGVVKTEFEVILSPLGRDIFKKFHLEVILDKIEKEDLDSYEKNWMKGMKEKYLIQEN